MEEDVREIKLDANMRMHYDTRLIHRIVAEVVRQGRTEETVIDWGTDLDEVEAEYDRMYEWFKSDDPQPYDCMFSKLKKEY